MISQKISEMFSNLEKCRSCMAVQERMLNFNFIFQDSPTLTLREIFSECTNLKSEINEYLPEQICLNCENELRIAYNFKKRCENSDIYFRRCLMRLDTVTSTTIGKPIINIKAEKFDGDYAADWQIGKEEVDEVTKSHIKGVGFYGMPNVKFDQPTRTSVIVSDNQKDHVKTEYEENLFHAEDDHETRSNVAGVNIDVSDVVRPQNPGTVSLLERTTEFAFFGPETSADCSYIDDNENTKEYDVHSDDSEGRSPSFPVCFVDCDDEKEHGNYGVLVPQVKNEIQSYGDDEETRSNVEDVDIENINVVRPQSQATVSFLKRITDNNDNIKECGLYSDDSAERSHSFLATCDVKMEHDYCQVFVGQIKNEPTSNDSEDESETHISNSHGHFPKYSYFYSTVAHKCSHCDNSYKDLITVQDHEWKYHKKREG